MIVVTGAGGFIGSVLIGYLNKQGFDNIIAVDELPEPSQYKNLVGKRFRTLIANSESIRNPAEVDCVVHLGAISNTLESNWLSLYRANVQSTRSWHDWCKAHQKKFIFASSASVYGNGAGPLNQYAFSKQVSEQEIDSGVILRLFNVYGPNEYHKGRMASTIYHWYNQIQATGQFKVFEGSRHLMRDFIYVEDVASTIQYFIDNYQPGTYDLGTGQSVDFETVGDVVSSTCRRGAKNFIIMPSDLKAQYQTNTRANTTALKEAGVDVNKFLSIGLGVEEYCRYLTTSQFY